MYAARLEAALALPEKVVLARPTGVGHALTAFRMPIEGRDEWIADRHPPSLPA